MKSKTSKPKGKGGEELWLHNKRKEKQLPGSPSKLSDGENNGQELIKREGKGGTG